MKHPYQQKKHSLLSNKQRGSSGVGKFKQHGVGTKDLPLPLNKSESNLNHRAKFDSALSNLKERSKINAKSRNDKVINAGLVLQQSILSPTVTSLPKEISIIDQLLCEEDVLDDKSNTQIAVAHKSSSKPLTNVYAVLDDDYSRVKPLLLQPSILAQSLQTLNTRNNSNIIDDNDI